MLRIEKKKKKDRYRDYIHNAVRYTGIALLRSRRTSLTPLVERLIRRFCDRITYSNEANTFVYT